MAVELATAYISLVSDTSKLAPSITKGTSGLDSTLEKSGKGLGGSLMKGIGGAALVGAAAVGAAAVGTLGVALTKGFQRLNSLDQATAKLEGLGHSAESVDAIMANALESVRGTAFGMDQAAGTAGSLVAAGIKPGEELERTLKLVADSATIAGTDMGDMGAIFGKVAANGKLTGEVMQQMMDRQIGVLPALADMYGVTNAEAQKMVSEGKVSFEDFAQVMENTLGGAALKSGETFEGAMANTQASLGRMGANFLAPVFEELAPTLSALTGAMGPLEDIATDLGEKFGDFLVPILETFQDMLNGGFDFGPFLELAGYLSPIGLAFKVLQPVLPQIMDALGQVASIIGGALGQVLQAVMPLITQLVDVLAQLWAQIIPPLLPIIVQLAEIISQVLLAVIPLIDPLMELIDAIFPVMQTVMAALIPIIQGVVDAIGAVLIPIVEMLVDVLGGVITFLTGVFSGDWEKAWQGIQDIFGGIFEGIVNIGKGVINGIIDLINGFIGGLNEVGNFVSDITGGSIDFSIGKIPHLAEGGTVLPRRGGTLAVLAEAGRAESVVDTGLLNRALEQGIAGQGSGPSIVQNNTFDHEDPAVAVEMAGQKLQSLARRSRV